MKVFTVKAVYSGHPWDPTNWPLYRGVPFIEFETKLVTNFLHVYTIYNEAVYVAISIYT